MIIDIFYIWSEAWIGYYDDGKTYWAYILAITTLGLYGAAIYLNVQNYNWFGEWGLGNTPTTVNLVLMGITTVLVFLRISPNASVLTTSAVSVFTSYLTWSAFIAQEDSRNEFAKDSSNTVIQITVGSLLCIISLLYICFGNSEESSKHTNVGGNVDLASSMLENKKKASDSINELSSYHDIELQNRADGANNAAAAPLARVRGTVADYQSNKYVYFHVVMTLASLYMAVFLTNYGRAQVGNGSYIQFETSALTVWIKLVASWVTWLVYIWTLIAPRLFPDREF
jgi:hypothetical protein